MLKCIFCGEEYPEEINETHCFCGNSKAEYTNLYSTSIKNYPFKESPLEKCSKDVFLKREDKNEFGSFKDRKSTFIYHILTSGKFALASSGNQAYSFAKICPTYAWNTYLYVSPETPIKKLKLLEAYKEIEVTDKILSDAELRKFEDDRWNITNGMDPFGASALYKLGMELESHDFDNIIVPLGSGELYSMLAVYFNILRNKHINIYPVKCNLPEADSIKTDFVAMEPFIEKQVGNQKPLELGPSETDDIRELADAYGCEFSSAVVFKALDYLNLVGKTCLLITGPKK